MGNREGTVFPADLASGGKAMLAARAAISISLPTLRFGEAVLPSLLSALKVGARDIEAEAYADT